ncbi:MAG: hypothetical protein R2911_21725 [Caldilineaceae bacterium]
MSSGVHHFQISSDRDLHWLRIPVRVRNSHLSLTLDQLPKDYDLFLFSGLERDISRRQTTSATRVYWGSEELGNVRDIITQFTSQVRVAFVEGIVPHVCGVRFGRYWQCVECCAACCKQAATWQAAENITLDVWDQSGWYYVLIAGHNGANAPAPSIN